MEVLETQTHEGFNKYLKNLFKQAENKQSKGVIKILTSPDFNYIFSRSNELLSKNIEHPKVEKIFEIVRDELEKNGKVKIIVFSQFRDTASLISKKLNEIPKIKSKIFVGQTKKTDESGSTGMSQKSQKKIIEDFSSGKINVLCATSIGEEGLDIPEVNAVIFYEPIASAIRTIQRAGRTARLMQGKLIMLITKKTRDEAYYYASKAKEKRMHSAIHDIKDEFQKGLKQEAQKKLL
jgi:Fanconi anemia group M protein